MGKVEKVVVLAVVFLVIVIFAVTLNTGDPYAQGPGDEAVVHASSEEELSQDRREPIDVRGPLRSRSSAALRPEPLNTVEVPTYRSQDPTPVAPGEVERGTGTSGLLTSNVEQPAPEPPPIAAGADWDLVSTAGLKTSPNPTLLLYVCNTDDTFETVATKLYGDAGRAQLVKQYNEGTRRLRAGMELLIPVRDDSVPTGAEHQVLDGENLWSIAKKVYGRGSRWSEIYDANRDLLKSPDSIQSGMTLRIP